MSKYTHIFYYGGENAHRHALRKRDALGGDAAVITASVARSAGVDVPKTVPGSALAVDFVVTHGKQTSADATRK